MTEYRVVTRVGTQPVYADDEQTAHRWAREWDRKFPAVAPHRVQRITEAWEDVPEPLPDLPTELWATYADGWDEPMVQIHKPSLRFRDRVRTFHASVTEWTEVTE